MAIISGLSPSQIVIFLCGLLCLSTLYSSVGHGGASGYLALMTLLTIPVVVMRPTALIFNIFVSGISFWFFNKSDYFRLKLFIPFAATSIPFAFLGGTLHPNPTVFKIILSLFLGFAGLRLLYNPHSTITNRFRISRLLLPIMGAVIGFFSGLIGIGGGIILSPIIILLGLGSTKESAAVSALFIFVNSISGLIGFGGHHDIPFISVFELLPIVVLGGIAGSNWGSRRFSIFHIKVALSAVLLMASIKMIFI